MKLSVKPQLLKYLVLGLGGLSLVLRVLLYTTGTDEKGLLAAGHWAHWAIWLLTALTVLLILFVTRPVEGPKAYRDCYPASAPAGLGAFAAAAGVLLASLPGGEEALLPVQKAAQFFGHLTAAALLATGVCRLMGAKPHFLLHSTVCLYFALRMVSQYQLWSSDPQLMNYCFHLCAYIALMLTAYHHAAFCTDMGSHRLLWLYSLAAVYLCCLCLRGDRDSLLMLTCGIWAYTNLTCLTPRPRRQRPALVLDDDGPESSQCL